MSLLQGLLKSISESQVQPNLYSDHVDSDDDWINVTSNPASPFPTRPSSPTRRQLRDQLQPRSRRDPLRLLPTEICQRIFTYLSLSDLANCTLVCRKWWHSQTLNYIWFLHYRNENFVDTSLPPGKWTKRESKQNWRVVHFKSLSEKKAPVYSRASAAESANRSGHQTPREIREERWRIEAEASNKPGKQEMREMYKELGGRKAKNKLKLGSSGVRDKGGWVETSSDLYDLVNSNAHDLLLTMKREVVSYADLQEPPPEGAVTPSSDVRPSKKYKRNNHANNIPPSGVASKEATPRKSQEELEERRELTHEEIWDDSALIEAWNAASEEYDAMNGPGKGWKEDPLHKSPLWYNVPSDAPKRKSAGASASISVPTANKISEVDSQPLDFATYVPSHNPNLDLSESLPNAQNLTEISRDEAFSRAMNAVYWAGYWTATYHARSTMTEGAFADQDPEA